MTLYLVRMNWICSAIEKPRWNVASENERYDVRPRKDRRRLESTWLCDLWTDPPGQRWEDFTHTTDEVVIVLEGELEFEVEGEVHHPESGEELLIPAGAVHSARNIGSTTARWLYGYHND